VAAPSQAQLRQIGIWADLGEAQLAALQSCARVRAYARHEFIMQEGDRLPRQLYTLLDGWLRVSKTSATGKETILRAIPPGELFAAPAMFGEVRRPQP